MEQLSLENGMLLDITLNIDWIYLSDKRALNILEEGSWKGWTPIDGLTNKQPELAGTG